MWQQLKHVNWKKLSSSARIAHPRIPITDSCSLTLRKPFPLYDILLFESIPGYKREFHASRFILHDVGEEAPKDLNLSQKNREAFTNPYIKSLRKFFLKVHPDFFAGQPQFQKQNQVAFQELNELLNFASEYANYASMPAEEQEKTRLMLHPPANRTFVFYSRPSVDDSSPGHTRIESKFIVPDSWVMDASRKSAQIITRQIDQCLLSLLSQAGIAKPELHERDSWLLNETEDETSERFPRVDTEYLREELRMALINNIQGKSIEKIKNGWWEDDIPSIDSLIKNKMLYLSRDISLKESQTALEMLRRNIHKMEFHKWNNIPLMIGASGTYAVNDPAPGFITIPFDLDVRKFLDFLDSNLILVTNQRKSTKERAKQIEMLRYQIEDELRLSKLSWNHAFINANGEIETTSLKSTQILHCLETLYNCMKEVKSLFGKYLNGAHIMIGNGYKISGTDGTIMISWDMKADLERNELIEFFKFIGAETLKRCSKLAIAMKRLTEDSKQIGTEIVERLACESLDVTTYSNHSIAQKYQFLKNLQHQCLYLSRFVWTGYKFILTDKDIKSRKEKLRGVKIDTDKKHVLIPMYFTEENLIAAVDEWDKERKNLLKGEEHELPYLDPNFVKGVLMLEKLVETDVTDPDFVDYYKTDLLTSKDVENMGTEMDEDEDDDLDDEEDENLNLKNIDMKKEGEETLKFANRMQKLYLKEKKFIQRAREREMEKTAKMVEKALKETDNDELRMKLITEFQKYISARQRSLEFRRADPEKKLDMVVMAVYEDVLRLYERRQKKKKEAFERCKQYKKFEKQKARALLNYDVKNERPLLTYEDVMTKERAYLNEAYSNE